MIRLLLVMLLAASCEVGFAQQALDGGRSARVDAVIRARVEGNGKEEERNSQRSRDNPGEYPAKGKRFKRDERKDGCRAEKDAEVIPLPDRTCRRVGKDAERKEVCTEYQSGEMKERDNEERREKGEVSAEHLVLGPHNNRDHEREESYRE